MTGPHKKKFSFFLLSFKFRLLYIYIFYLFFLNIIIYKFN